MRNNQEFGLIKQCCKCRRVRLGSDNWDYVQLNKDEITSHGYCPPCETDALLEIEKYYT